MAEEDDSSKTEEPTDRKLSKAREEGDVPLSQEVKSWIMLVGVMIVLWSMVPTMMEWTMDSCRTFIAQAHEIPMSDSKDFRFLFFLALKTVGKILFLPIGLLLILAFIGTMVQIGFLYAPKRIEPKWEKLNIFTSLKEFVSPAKMIEAGKGLFKVAAVLAASALVVGPKLAIIPSMPGMAPMAILAVLHDIILMFIFTVVIVMMVIAGADFMYQKLRYIKKHKMSKQEMKDEYKNSEGDPQVKARIRSIRMERFRQRMMSEVPTSTVVVTNPTHYAVALKYILDEMDAPVVVAKGVDHLAFRIRNLAEESEVPVVENPPLARALYATVEIDGQVPEEHFKAVAEVIGYVMRLKNQLPQTGQP